MRKASGTGERSEIIDFQDFSRFENLENRMVGTARLWLNKTAVTLTDDEIALFVHGAFHGAWCYAAYLEYLDRHGIAAGALDLTGHGGLGQPSGFHEFGVVRFARDVTDAIDDLNRRVFLVGHSVGALICIYAAQALELTGLGLLAPSPPGNLPNASPVRLRPAGRPVEVPTLEYFSNTYLKQETGWDMTGIHSKLCPESSTLMNERYSLQIVVDPNKIVRRGFCIEAGREDTVRHPVGQDLGVAEFLGLRHILLPSAPHCMMIAPSWRESARLVRDRLIGRQADDARLVDHTPGHY